MFIVLLIIASTFLVYYDASKNSIGKIPDTRGFFNLSAGMWALSTGLLWTVAFPAYLIKRSRLIDLAKERPQKPSSWRYIWLGFIGIIFVLVILGYFA